MFGNNYNDEIRELQIKNEELTQIITGILRKLNLFAIEEKNYHLGHLWKQYNVLNEKEVIKNCEINKNIELAVIKRKVINQVK